MRTINARQVGTHIGFWLLYTGLWTILNYVDLHPYPAELIQYVAVLLIVQMLVGYVCNYALIPPLFYARRYGHLAVAYSCLILTGTFLIYRGTELALRDNARLLELMTNRWDTAYVTPALMLIFTTTLLGTAKIWQDKTDTELATLTQLAQREAEKSLLLQTSEAIATIRSKTDLFNVIFKQVKPVFGLADAAIVLFDHQTQEAYLLTTSADTQVADTPVHQQQFDHLIQNKFSIGQAGFWQWLTTIEAPTAVTLMNLENNFPDFEGLSLMQQAQLGSFLLSPLRTGGQKLGIFLMAFLDAQVPLLPDLTMYESVANQVAVAISNMQANEELIDKEKVKLETELRFLKAQINPHFLFNTLNGIFHLIDSDPALAQETLAEFSAILRYHLYQTDAGVVPLETEILHIRSFANLEQLRKGPGLEVYWSIGENIGSVQLAPLILLTFIENAFKHVSTWFDKPNWVRIQVSREADTIRFRLGNSTDSRGKRSANESEGGIGLVNIRRRLELLYPGSHRLHYEHNINEYWVDLTIQL